MADPLKERENLYKLMISQLRYDGFEAIASTVAKVVNIISACPPMARLHQVVNLGIQAETEGVKPESITIPGLTPPTEPGRGIDLEYEPEGSEVNWGSETTSADESFMNNLELQKVTEEPENVPIKSKEDNPSNSDVLHHILQISSAKKPLYPVQESNTLLPMASSTLDQGASAMDVVEQVKIELVKYKVSQEVFAKAVLGKSQGYLSEILKHGDSMFTPSDQTHCRGWLNFETMREFLKKSEAERLRIYQQKGDELKLERMKRRHMDMGGTGADPPIKRRRCIQPEAKAFMEDYYNCYNRYLSTEKRELLANVLAIPEQCVSDFFKNLRSRRKCDERMQCLLKGVECPEERQESVTVTDNCGLESHNASKPQLRLPSCSDQTEAEVYTSVTQTAVKNESLYQVSLHSNCASTSKPVPVTSRDACSADLVVSKIAALAQSQQIQRKRPVFTNVYNPASCKASLNDHRETSPATSAHSLSMMGRDTAATVESFSLDNIPVIDGSCSPVILHGGIPEMQNLEVGQQIYVVNVNNSV